MDRLGCQLCHTSFKKVSEFKKHSRSDEHRKVMKDVFNKKMYSFPGCFPHIVFLDRHTTHEIKQPIIGLSLLTLCFSPDTETCFYLCHVCEEKHPPRSIMHHLASGDHYSNYLSYTDPNLLSFSWMPSMDMRSILRPHIINKVKVGESATLQLMDLPESLIKTFEKSTYSKVMHTLCDNDKFVELFEASKPKRMMIETYQKHNSRKHPLLGMQHLVECVGPSESHLYYLCTLCNLTLATHAVIKHVLSFDHIFCYFKAWHPSTLMTKECYQKYTESFTSMMLHFAEQAQEIHGTANTDIKRVSLKAAEFTSVNFTCYAEALKKLESITKDNEGSSLTTVVTPGIKLAEHRAASASSAASSYKLRCQNCSVVFETVSEYLQHLPKPKHKESLKKLFKQEGNVNVKAGFAPKLSLYKFCQEQSHKYQPVVGASLVVSCVSTQIHAEPIHVCFACQECFFDSSARQHIMSVEHLIHTLLYQNPWLLPFAWNKTQDLKDLTSVAYEEEEKRGPSQMLLKVLDIPSWQFQSLIPQNSFQKVMQILDNVLIQHTVLKNEVPQCETYSKLKENEPFPLLGNHFLVKYKVCAHNTMNIVLLCLLCERILSREECYAHVFSREHVAEFLNRHYPGSVGAAIDAETLLDLAKQAACIQSISHVQDIDELIMYQCDYHTATRILASTKRRQGGGGLEPKIIPKMKLLPRDVNKNHVGNNNQTNNKMMEGSQDQTSDQSTHSTLKQDSSAEHGSEITNNCAIKTETVETPCGKESEKRGDVFPKGCPDEQKSAGTGRCCVIKEEDEERSIQESTKTKLSEEMPERCSNTESDRAKPGNEGGESYKDVPTLLKTEKENERKRPNSAQEVTFNDEDLRPKRQCLTLKPEPSSKEYEKMTNGGIKGVAPVDEGESDKPSHAIVNNSGLRMQVTGLQTLQGSSHPSSSNSASSGFQPVCSFSSVHVPHKATSVTDNMQVVDMELETDSEMSEAEVSSMIETTSKATEVPRELNAHVKPIRSYTLLYPVPVSDDTFKSDPTGNNGKDKTGSHTTAASLYSTATIHTKPMTGISKCAATAASATASTAKPTCSTAAISTAPTSIKCRETEYKFASAKSTAAAATFRQTGPTATCAATSSKSAAASTASTGSTCTLSMSISNAPSAMKSTTVSTPKETTTGAASVITSGKAAPASQTESTMMHEAATLSSETHGATTAKTGHMKNAEGANAHVAPPIQKNNPPAALHQTAAAAVWSEDKDPTQTSMSNTTPNKTPPQVGLNQLIRVSCERKQQVYCMLCSVRLKPRSHHRFSISHQYNYVKMKYPGWTATQAELESKLEKIVANLAEVEKDMGLQRGPMIEVKSDLYKELGCLPENIAIERLKTIMKQRELQGPSSSTTEPGDTLRHDLVFASPSDVTSPFDEIHTPESEMPGLSSNGQMWQWNEHQLQAKSAYMPEIKSNLMEEEDLLERTQSYIDKNPAANDQITDQYQSRPDITADKEPQAHGCDPRVQNRSNSVSQLESAGVFDQSPDVHQEKRQEHEKPDIFDADAVKISSVVSHSLSTHTPAALGSNLSKYLTVRGHDAKSVIGLGSVWECKGISLHTFYLCESCSETLSLTNIFRHLESSDHQLNYMVSLD